MKQYWDAKNSLSKDHFLFFRLGDFYEMFYDDAVKAAPLLELTLTQRGDSPMCGVPAHTIDNYIKRLLALNKKVAICEQTSLAQKGNLVQREIVEKISPGTISNSIYLDSNDYNFLVALIKKDEQVVFAWIDISTADLFVETKAYSIENIRMMMGKLKPKELLFPDSQEELLWINKLCSEFSIFATRMRDWDFTISEGEHTLKEILKVHTLSPFNLDGGSIELSPISALLHYVKDSKADALAHVNGIRIIKEQDFLELDADAIYNLEIFHAMRDGNKSYSLIGLLDRCQTCLGSRELYKWLSFPLKNVRDINDRLDNIEYFVQYNNARFEIKNRLQYIIDMPRIMTRVTMNKAHPKDLVALRESMRSVLHVYDYIIMNIDEPQKSRLQALLQEEHIKIINELISRLDTALLDMPPIQFGSAPVIKTGYEERLDYLRSLHENQQAIMQNYLEEEQAKVPFTLKLKFNNAIGYFFDITSSHKHQCPEYFILRQSLTKQDRYKTEKLITLETEILSAESSLYTHEEQLFNELRDYLKEYTGVIKQVSDGIATLDVYVSLAELAVEYNYVRPKVHEDDYIDVIQGRHPVIESVMAQGDFIANDLHLDNEKQSFIMLTGPNMAGKSTYLRQNALIVIMAQLGSFVPAESASIGVRDRIFCRVGASDNLVKGESTFLVEMSETAYILQHATTHSLVIMDEIGRGTSVNDGESIAQAVAEYFLERRIFALFATHYHNLTDLEYPNMKNFTLSIEKHTDQIIFTRHLKEGAVKNSYGIEVAKLAGIPNSVLSRAKVLLQQHVDYANQVSDSVRQLSLGLDEATSAEEKEVIPAEIEEILDDIIGSQLNEMTPIETMQYLAEIQKRLRDARNL